MIESTPMKKLGLALLIVFVCLLAISHAFAGNVLEPVAIHPAEGRVVAAAFSPDSHRLAVVRSVNLPDASRRRLTLQLMELASGKEISYAEIPRGEAAELAFGQHFISYSSDGQRLIFATEGSDVLSLIDANTLVTVKQFPLHAEAASAHHGFQGVVSVSVSANSDLFGVMRHDESGEDEVFVGSFSSAQIVKKWSLGHPRAATQLGETSLSLNEDGSLVAVSVLSERGGFPKAFRNLRLYNATNGEMVKSIRTRGLIGQIALMPDKSVLAARIDVPGLFSLHPCIEKWKFESVELAGHYCDPGHSVTTALDASVAANRVVSFSAHIEKDEDGHYLAERGRVGLWNLQTGKLLATLGTFRQYTPVKISPNGRWILAGTILLQVSTTN
jgi:hypothetical protein